VNSLEGKAYSQPSTLRRIVLPITLGLATATTAGGQHHTDRIFHPVSNADQTAFTTYYGHLPKDFPDTSIETGNIADNFKPAAGWGKEFTEIDVQYFFGQLEEIKRAGFDGITISWHGINDTRDKAGILYGDAMLRCDSPAPGLKRKLMIERLANPDIDSSDETMDRIMDHLWKYYLSSPNYFLTPEGLPELDFFTGDNPEWVDDAKITEKLHRLEVNWGINAVARSTLGSNIQAFGRNQFTDEIDTFPYGFQFYDLWPSGLEMTAHQATVTPEYSKVERGMVKERDFKVIHWDPDKTRQNIREARSSQSELFNLNTYNEWPETTGFANDEEKITLFGEELYDPGDDVLHDTFPAPCTEPDSFFNRYVQNGENQTVLVEFPSAIPLSQKKGT